jgi:hypothetical protein
MIMMMVNENYIDDNGNNNVDDSDAADNGKNCCH